MAAGEPIEQCCDQAAWHRAQRPKRCKLVKNPALARVVADKLQLEWSPHQVAG